MAKQQADAAKQHQQLMEALLRGKQEPPETDQKPTAETIAERALKKLEPFRFDPDGGSSFEGWYDRFEPVFTKDAATLDDSQKILLLCQRLDQPVYDRLRMHLQPKRPEAYTFEEVIKSLKTIYGRSTSLFSLRHAFFRLQRKEGEDRLAFWERTNDLGSRIDAKNFSEDNLKMLALVCGLEQPEDRELSSDFFTASSQVTS